MLILLLASVGLALAQFNAPLVFTGNAEADFQINGVNRNGVVTLDDPTLDALGNRLVQPDVGVPPGWPYPFSGWDIENIFFQIDFT